MPHNYNLRSTHAAPAAPAAPESLFFNETSPFHDVFNPKHRAFSIRFTKTFQEANIETRIVPCYNNPKPVALDHELYVPYLREPASAFGKKTVKLWTTKATTTKVTATKKSLWRMYAADKTRELFD